MLSWKLLFLIFVLLPIGLLRMADLDDELQEVEKEEKSDQVITQDENIAKEEGKDLWGDVTPKTLSLIASDEDVVPYHEYVAPYPVVWRAVIKALSPYPLQYANKFLGVVTTRWVDDSLWMAFLEDTPIIPQAFKVLAIARRIVTFDEQRKQTVIIRVSLYKRKKILNEELMAFHPQMTSHLLEETLFYRIGQIITNELLEKKSEKNNPLRNDKVIN